MGTHTSPSRSRSSTQALDVGIGQRVRLRRTILGLTQQQLGVSVGLSFQQIQKYERGLNRISASLLVDLGRALDVPVSFFFDDLPAPPDPVPAPESLLDSDTASLINAFQRIDDPQLRRRAFELVKAMGAAAVSVK